MKHISKNNQLYNELKKHHNVKRQFKPIWCKNLNTNKYLPFDFVLEDLRIIVEQDGDRKSTRLNSSH